MNIRPSHVYGPAATWSVAASRTDTEMSAWTPGVASMWPTTRTAGPMAWHGCASTGWPTSHEYSSPHRQGPNETSA